MHISEQIAAELIRMGFEARINGDFSKMMPTGGTFGRAMVRVRIVHTRWFESVDGWDNVTKDIDLRDYTDATSAIAALIG